mmetsp:Transcript_2347/g.2407  ORF Transcript_2347/g.2407 Transcript_2347/m.2407 type:complete len:243 (-) Transcript_2347:53-781(-)
MELDIVLNEEASKLLEECKVLKRRGDDNNSTYFFNKSELNYKEGEERIGSFLKKHLNPNKLNNREFVEQLDEESILGKLVNLQKVFMSSLANNHIQLEKEEEAFDLDKRMLQCFDSKWGKSLERMINYYLNRKDFSSAQFFYNVIVKNPDELIASRYYEAMTRFEKETAGKIIKEKNPFEEVDDNLSTRENIGSSKGNNNGSQVTFYRKCKLLILVLSILSIGYSYNLGYLHPILKFLRIGN